MSDHFWEKSYPAGVGWDIEVGVKPLYAVFDEAVAAWPRNRMVDFLDKRLTYTDVDDLIDRAAKGFQALGVSPGVQVALFLPNTPHFIVCFFAILKAGGTVVTLSPLDAERTLQHKLTDSEAKLVVTLDLNALYPMMARLVEQTGVERIVVGSLPDFLPFPKNLLFPLARRGDIAAVPRDERHVRFADLIANDGRFDGAAEGRDADALQPGGGDPAAPPVVQQRRPAPARGRPRARHGRAAAVPHLRAQRRHAARHRRRL
jgi:long-chain acyl-CoA synthetase